MILKVLLIIVLFNFFVGCVADKVEKRLRDKK